MNDQELLKLVEETRTLSLENNRILHSIQRREKAAFVFKVVYWVIILGIAAGAFYYIQPYIDELMKAYTGLVDTQKKVVDVSSKFSMDNIKNYFK